MQTTLRDPLVIVRMAIIKAPNVCEGVEKEGPCSLWVTGGVIGAASMEISVKGSQKTNTRTII